MSGSNHAFTHCPRCGAPNLEFDGVNRFRCHACEFVFYQNTAAAVGVILTVDDRDGAILLLRRAVPPAQGMLDFPGGFVDPGESIEDALRREVREEIDSDIEELSYLSSGPNRYLYRDVLYPTCDIVFTGRIHTGPTGFDHREISEVLALPAGAIDPEEIAFPSLRRAMRLFLRGR